MSQQTASSAEVGPRPTPTVFRRRKRRLPFPLAFYGTAVGKKWVMALTGIALIGYVVVHMIGNLHLYEGPRQVNEYGEALRGLGGDLAPRTLVLWLMRVGLATAFVLHIHAAYSLTLLNMRARPVRYESRRDYVAANFASRSMRWTGTIVLLFLLYHLADLTWGWLNPDFIRGDPYNNVVESMSNPIVAAFYLLSMIVLSIHLFHGTWSLFQSLGLNNPRYNSWRRGLAFGIAGIILVGNCSFPIAVTVGLISQDDRCWPSAPAVEEALAAGATLGQIEEEVASLEEQGVCIFEEEQAGNIPAPGEQPDGVEQVPQQQVPQQQIPQQLPPGQVPQQVPPGQVPQQQVPESFPPLEEETP